MTPKKTNTPEGLSFNQAGQKIWTEMTSSEQAEFLQELDNQLSDIDGSDQSTPSTK